MIPTGAMLAGVVDATPSSRPGDLSPFTGRPLQGAAMAHGGEVARQGLSSMSSDRFRPTFCN